MTTQASGQSSAEPHTRLDAALLCSQAAAHGGITSAAGAGQIIVFNSAHPSGTARRARAVYLDAGNFLILRRRCDVYLDNHSSGHSKRLIIFYT